MTPERRRQISDLFDEALGLDPGRRDAWLRRACGDDEGLRAEVAFLLDREGRPARGGSLAPPEPAGRRLEATGSWHPRVDRTPPREAGGFTPKAVIRAGARSHPSGGVDPLAPQRLRVLVIIYLLIAGLMLFWKYVVLGDPDPTQAIPYVVVLAALGGVVALLSLPRS